MSETSMKARARDMWRWFIGEFFSDLCPLLELGVSHGVEPLHELDGLKVAAAHQCLIGHHQLEGEQRRLRHQPPQPPAWVRRVPPLERLHERIPEEKEVGMGEKG